MATYASELKDLTKKAELIQEQIGLMQRLSAIEAELNGTVIPKAVKVKTVKASGTGTSTGKRGRPKGSKNVAKIAVEGAVEGAEGEKKLSLPTLLTTISQEVKKPISNGDFVKLVLEAGYKSKAKDFSNMVYQALRKLVEEGTFTRHEVEGETPRYEAKVA